MITTEEQQKEAHKDFTVSFRAHELQSVISALQPIAVNNKLPVERIISFFVYDGQFGATAKDGIAYASIEGTCSFQGKNSFALRVEDLMSTVKDIGTITMHVKEEIVIMEKGNSTVQLVKYLPNCTPFRNNQGIFELVPSEKMLRVVQRLSKYISADMNEFNAVMLSEGYGYVRDHLCYMITPLEIGDTVVFSKTMAKQFNSIFNKVFAVSADNKIAVRFNPDTSLTELVSGKANLRFKSFDYRGTDLSKFTAFFNAEGNSMHREELLDAVREIIAIEKCNDVYVSLEPSRTKITPKKDNTKTELIIKAASSDKVEFGHKFQFTTNLNYLEKILAGMNSKTVAIAKQGNFCILINEEREIPIRYFLATL